MKTTFVIIDDILKDLQTESSAKRVFAVAPFMTNTFINSNDDFVRGCDVVIYQDRIEHHDYIMMKTAHKQQIILDLSFPVWNPHFPYNAGSKLTYFYKMVKLCSSIVVPCESYAIDLKKYVKDRRIEVIPTGHDEEGYKKAANAYMDLMKPVIPTLLITTKEGKKNNGLYLSPQDRLEELKKKTKLLILEEPDFEEAE